MYMRYGFLLLLSPLVVSVSLAATRHEKKPSASEIYHKNRMRPSKDGPCKVILNACLGAGFHEPGPSGHDAKKDCRDQILKGRSVKRVSLLPAVVESCRQQKSHENE